MKGFQIITIEREYGSGGNEVGHRLGELLGIPCYGKEILELTAKAGNTTPDYIEHLEETSTGSLLYSLMAISSTAQGLTPGPSGADALNALELKIVKQLADKGSCVLVGRCAGWLLRERKDVLNVFVHADENTRLRRAAERYGVPEGQAGAVLRQFDKRRANFYHAVTGKAWRERDGYHLVLDSGLLGMELCARTLAAVVESSRD